jgi:enterochelin esterase-like enzyme
VNLLFAVLLAVADGGPPPPAVPDTLVSPEVGADRHITLRIRAPHASRVTVSGEWSHPPNTPQPLTRDAQGVWSLTVGPVDPNIYIYVFSVDGLAMIDPVNPSVKLRARGAASMVEVPGDAPWALRDVPHGAIHVHTQVSGLLGGPRQLYVYTPPGYDARRTVRYPVVYLFHGTNDTAAGWTLAGRANLILDNLIADKKAVPFIAVMPWGHAVPYASKPSQANADVFEHYLVEEVAPLVEASYRIAPGRNNHALVGLSMGGQHALQIGLAHRDQFASVGMFGSAPKPDDVEPRIKTGPPFRLWFVGAGKEDGVYPRARALTDFLKAHGLPATFHEVEGGHVYGTWRRLLAVAAPLLFR